MSQWIAVNKGNGLPDTADMPRHLTVPEINIIASNLPQAFTKDVTSAVVIRQGLMKALAWSLSRVMISPSMIPKFVNIMIYFYRNSLIQPGTAVGMAATEAIAAILTQATLNTFHYSGSSQSIGGSVSGARDIIQATETPKNPVTMVHFVNKHRTFAEVLDERKRITGTSIADCINKDPARDYRVGKVEDIPRLWWEGPARALLRPNFRGYQPQMQLRLYFNPTVLYKHGITLSMIAKVLQNEHPPSVVILYGPTSEGIMDIYPTGDIDKDIHNILKMAVNPHEIAVFEELFLNTIVYPELTKLKVKGITGMGDLLPVKMPVWSMVLYEVALSKEILQAEANDLTYQSLIGQAAWLLYFNQSNMRKTGLTPGHVAELCTLAKMSVLKIHDDYLIVQLPLDCYQLTDNTVVTLSNGALWESVTIKQVLDTSMVEVSDAKLLPNGQVQWSYHGKKIISNPDQLVLFEGQYYRPVAAELVDGKLSIKVEYGIKGQPITPSKFLLWKLSIDKEIYDQQVQTRNEEIAMQSRNPQLSPENKQLLLRMPVQVPVSQLKARSEYVYAIVQGENLGPILALSGVDRRRTTCTNMHVLRKIFGIENCRAYIVRAIHGVITSSGSYIHPTHINLIAELMCSRGIPMGLSFTAVGRLNFGHITGSTIAKASQILIRSAIHGREESVSNTSAAISMGALINIGTGYTDVAQQVTIGGKRKVLINDEITAKFKDTDEEKYRNIGTVSQEGTLDDDDLRGLQELNTTLDFTEEGEKSVITYQMPFQILPADENDMGQLRNGNIAVPIQPVQVVGITPGQGQAATQVQETPIIIPIPGLPDLSNLTIDRILTAQTINDQINMASLDPTGLMDLNLDDQ